MKIHHLTVAEALASLQSGVSGLSDAEVKRRLAEYGPNTVEKIRHGSLAVSFLKGFVHFFAIILWVAAALAFFAEIFDPDQGMATLGYAIVGVILLNNIFSFWQEYRAERTLDALQKLLPNEVTVIRDGREKITSAPELVPGDVILLEAGNTVPADCRLMESFSLRVNNATITGESAPHSRDAAPSSEIEYLSSRNILLAGTSVVSGEGKAVVFGTGAHSAFGEIARLTQTAKESISPLQLEISRLSRWVAVLALGLGVIFFIIGEKIGLSFWQNFIFAIGIIVANVPEGLLPAVTLALAMGSQRMAKRNALIRHLPAVETLGCATVICTDKTGTLTENKMTVKTLFLEDRAFELPKVEDFRRLVVNHARFFEGALLCENIRETERVGRSEIQGDPMEKALVEMANQAKQRPSNYSRIYEMPFDSNRKRLSTLYKTPDGLVLYMKGAPEVVLPLCQEAQTDQRIIPICENGKTGFQQVANSMAENGLRVIALAYRAIPIDYDPSQLEENLVFSGLVGFEDPPRPEVPEAIRKCHEAGIRVVMVTGDHPSTASAIARQIGLVKTKNPVVLTGPDLKKISDTQLQLALDAPEIIFARVAADQKMRIVTALKNKKQVVAVTGDGVNDAPALKRADIGIAMGLSGTDVARESADIVLLDDNFATIVAAIEEGRAVFSNIRKFLTYILTSNIPELVPFLAFVLFRIPLPLTIIQILAVDLVTDMVPALGLGAEPPNSALLKQPPRSTKERLVNFSLIARAYLWLGPIQGIAAMSAFFFVLHSGGWQWGVMLSHNNPIYLQATTSCLSAIVVMQIANVFICRSRRRSALQRGLFRNKLIWAAILVEVILILLIDYTPWGNQLFATAPIPLRVWFFVMPFALVMLALEELRKSLVRKRTKHSEYCF